MKRLLYLLVVVTTLPDLCHLKGCETMLDVMKTKNWETDYRIPQSTQPLNYDLYLFPDLVTGTFSGRVAITIQTLEPRAFFVTHIKYLTVTSTVLKTESGEVVPLADAFEYAPNEFWVVIPGDQPLTTGIYTLSLEFNGRLDNGILGFYRSVYVDTEGKEHKIATSKFQPTYARRAFPCFDEPSFKSTFRTTLVKPNSGNYVALSNMPEASSLPDAPEEGFTEVTFQLSVPMVTYLAVFIVCDFEYIETVTAVHKIPFRVYGTAQQKNRLQYAMKIGAGIADFYETYFGIPYPLPKLDMAAIPDYSSGATEHWGLITYRETNLIYDPTESSSADKERVADVIAHELAHQWFGNLMTVNWWNDLWLNEGFATYIEYKGVQSYETDWDMESRFLTSDLHRVLELDATFGSHPIVVDVDTPDQINAVFDTISYSKGASVIRMMESFLGKEDFRKGISNFLTKYSYGNAVTEDLLRELTAVSTEGLNVTSIMDTWTRQKGFPVLTLTKIKNVYSIQQERFLADIGAYTDTTDVPSPFNYKWEIPVSYITSAQPKSPTQKWFHIDDDVLDVKIDGLGDTIKWAKFNVGQYGYYRVNYPVEDWVGFSQLLQTSHEELSSSDRTNLINDAFSLAAGGRLKYDQALDLTLYLGDRERSLSPWVTAFLSLDKLAGVLYYSPVYPSLNAYIVQLLSTPYAQVGWEEGANDSVSTQQMRTFVLDKMCVYGVAARKAGEKLLAWKETGEKISPNFRKVVYRYGMKAVGDQQVWRWMMETYKSESNAQEKLKLLLGLTATAEPWILSHLLELARDEAIIRSQDYFTLLTYMSWNKVGEPIVWDFVRCSWQYLVERFTLNDRLLGRLIPSITEKFATPLRLEEMRTFFAKYPQAGAGENYRKIALETVENNIKFVSDGGAEAVQRWLDAH